MNDSYYIKILIGSSLVAITFASTAQAKPSASAAPSQGEPTIHEASTTDTSLVDIVVTAQKREQRLQDVPVSITALDTDMLTANRVQNISDLNAISPNTTMRESAGGVGLPVVTMRGALSQGVGEGQDREVGFYVDGVYIGHAQGSQFDLADIERVEVLRGPQGTLFGRNATGGAISIVTKEPKGEFDLSQELTFGNYDQFRSKTRIDTPAFGPFSGSLTYVHSERRGDTRNLGAGTVWNYGLAGLGLRTSPKWLGDQNVESIAAALKFDPGGDFTAVYKFDWSDSKGTPVAFGTAGFGPAIDGGLTSAIFSAQPDPLLLSPITTHRPKAVNNAFTTENTGRVQGHNLTASWRISDALTVKNILAYRRVRAFATQDITGLGGTVVPDGSFYGTPFSTIFQVPVGTPLLLGSNATGFHHEQISDEFQLNINAEQLTITSGLVYYHQKQDNGAPAGIQNGYLFVPAFNNSLICTAASACQGPNPVKGTSKAAYIQAEVHITPELDAVVGYRMTNDKKSGRSLGLNTSFKINDNNPAYLFGLNYKISRDILLFGKYSQSYMSGGGNTGRFSPVFSIYDPEKAYSWEVGVKSDLLNRHLRLNLSLFTVKYKNIQYVTGGNVCGDSAAGTCTFNAAGGRAKGFELETTILPVNGLTLSGGVGYTDFKYLDISPEVLASTGLFRPQLRPKWTSNLTAQYETRPLFNDAYLSFRLDANFRSKTRLDPLAPDMFNSQATVPGIWILNGRAALADVDIGGHKAEVALWGRNLTNDDHISFLTVFQFMYPVSYERARTFGVDMKINW